MAQRLLHAPTCRGVVRVLFVVLGLFMPSISSKRPCPTPDLDYYHFASIDLHKLNASEVEKHYCEYGQFESRPLKPPPSKPLPNKTNFRVIMLTHSLGGGIATYISEQTPYFVENDCDVWRVEVTYIQNNVGMNVSRYSSTAAGKFDHYEFTVLRSYNGIKNFFFRLKFDLIYVNYMHFSENLIRYFATENVPFVYTLHDHHPIATSLIDDMSLTCNETENNFAVPSQLVAQQRGVIASFGSVLRRAMFLTTPSYSNKLIYQSVWPQLNFHYIPNRPVAEVVPKLDAQQSLSWQKDLGQEFRIVVLGAIGISKGARIIQRVAALASKMDLPIKIHLVGHAHWNASESVHVVQHGPFKTEDELQAVLRSIRPHAAWFPATRHESYCYVLDSAIYAGLPIVASATGSFTERLSCRSDAWVFGMCITPEKWLQRLLAVRHDLLRGRSSRTTKALCTTLPKPSFDHPRLLFAEVLTTLKEFPGLGVGRYDGEWIESIALNPSLYFDKHVASERDFWLQYQGDASLLRTKRMTLDTTFYQDRHALHHLTGFNELREHFARSDDKKRYNVLHEVSSASLLIAYMTIKEGSCRRQISYSRNANRAAILIDPRHTPLIKHVTLCTACKLGSNWNFYLYTKNHEQLALDFASDGHKVVARPFPVKENMPSAYKTSKILLDAGFWQSFTEEYILIYQTDSFLLRSGIQFFLDKDYSFLGAYSEGFGHNSTTPRGIGVNGGLSLRKRSFMLDCIKSVHPFQVNEYRKRNGMHEFFHNPEKNEYYMEDIFYYHCAEMKGAPMPSPSEQSSFAVQEFFNPDTMAVHGFDKGWYLTTAQLQVLRRRAFDNRQKTVATR